MSRLALLHHDLEWTEARLAQEFRAAGHTATLLDVREVGPTDFDKFDLVLNRVYASVANRAFDDTRRCLELLRAAGERGVPCLNDEAATRADYSKLVAARLMTAHGIRTPLTIRWPGAWTDAVEAFIDHVGWPLVVKRDTGGRALDLGRPGDRAELDRTMAARSERARHSGYAGDFVLQAFVTSAHVHDFRVGVVAGRPVFVYGRTLIALETGESPWLASVANGSRIVDHPAYDADVLATAVAATHAIGAVFNEVDIVVDAAGPIVIENNPTPNYIDEPADIERLRAAVAALVRWMEALPGRAAGARAG